MKLGEWVYVMLLIVIVYIIVLGMFLDGWGIFLVMCMIILNLISDSVGWSKLRS